VNYLQSSSFKGANWFKLHYESKAMLRLEQITALVLAAALAIPSYWFFWTMAGGGGYERRGIKDNIQDSLEIPSTFKN
tara:strand:+ start:187 stop:420 length:234 start_codon:yes stop_codon:yes gene_type:complete